MYQHSYNLLKYSLYTRGFRLFENYVVILNTKQVNVDKIIAWLTEEITLSLQRFF